MKMYIIYKKFLPPQILYCLLREETLWFFSFLVIILVIALVVFECIFIGSLGIVSDNVIRVGSLDALCKPFKEGCLRSIGPRIDVSFTEHIHGGKCFDDQSLACRQFISWRYRRQMYNLKLRNTKNRLPSDWIFSSCSPISISCTEGPLLERYKE